jgi:hypothetical protein
MGPLGPQSSPKEDSNISSAELVFGCPVTVPGQFLDTPEPPPAHFVEALQSISLPPNRLRSYASVAAVPPPALMKASFVYIRKGGSIPPLSPPYDGPFAVVGAGPKFFTVDVGGKRETISIDRLKPHTGQSSPSPAVPPKKGCPRATIGSSSAVASGPPGLGLGGSPVATPTHEKRSSGIREMEWSKSGRE